MIIQLVWFTSNLELRYIENKIITLSYLVRIAITSFLVFPTELGKNAFFPSSVRKHREDAIKKIVVNFEFYQQAICILGASKYEIDGWKYWLFTRKYIFWICQTASGYCSFFFHWLRRYLNKMTATSSKLEIAEI